MSIRSTRTATVLLGTLLSAGLIFAQSEPQQAPDTTAPAAQQPMQGRHFDSHPNRQARRLAKKLNLSKDQQAQIKPILVDRARQMQALHADSSLAPADRRAKAQAIQQDSRSKIEAVLNDQQKQQFEQFLAQRQARRYHNQNQPATQPGQ